MARMAMKGGRAAGAATVKIVQAVGWFYPDSLGVIEIGAHTADHAIFAHADRAQQRAQIARAKAQLESWIGCEVTAFAYPNGRPGLDYSALSVKLVEDLGFDFGFTTRQAFAGPDEPPLERSRFLMLAGISPAELAHCLSYSWRR